MGGMVIILLIYALELVAFLLLLWVSWRFFDKRYRRRDDSVGSRDIMNGSFTPTSEVFIDPKDGHKYQVYYNHRTGEREYIRLD